MKRLFIALFLVVVVLVGLLGWKLRAQALALTGPAAGSGVVEGTTVRLSSRVGGRIVEVAVKEGQQVAEGDLILRFDCVEPDAALAQANAMVDAARRPAEAADLAADAAGVAVGAARAMAEAAEAQARALDPQGAAAGRQADRVIAMETDISEAQRDQARSTASGMQAQSEAAAAQRRAGSAQASAASSQAQAARAQAEAALTQVAAALAALTRAQVSQAECRVIAPRAATVQLLPYELGELVGPGQTLATLVDTSHVTASFYLPNADLWAAKPGGPAEISADAWPLKTFAGTVSTVSTEAEFTPRNIQTRTDRDRLVYKVEVDLENVDGALRPGMPVQVTLVGTER